LYDEVDRISKTRISTLKEKILSLSQEDLWRLIDEITGGLGYTKEERDVTRLIIYGSYIAWAEAVKPGSKVLEIGTGLGRTCYAVLSSTSPSLYLTIDSSPEILAVALYRNPYPSFQEALLSPVVKVCLCDATVAVRYTDDSFDHIIHDGGPNPNKNPALFSTSLLSDLVSLLKTGGTFSIFGSKNRKWQDRLYRELRTLGLLVTSKPLPYSPVLVFHCVKE
jgi:spermidine synthase